MIPRESKHLTFPDKAASWLESKSPSLPALDSLLTGQVSPHPPRLLFPLVTELAVLGKHGESYFILEEKGNQVTPGGTRLFLSNSLFPPSKLSL